MPAANENFHIELAGAARTRLAAIARAHAPAALASSFGAEDMVLIDLIARDRLPIRVFTLDTGRLHQETADLIDTVRRHYGIGVTVHVPDTAALEAHVHDHGQNAFYASVELRRRCCEIRKTEPLRRALIGAHAWITGQRRGQGITRADLPLEQFDSAHGLPKFNPLAEWSEDQVWSYLRTRDVPVNALHARGYPSIGCAPCTRPVAPGEDSRAGRWWWERPEHRECGLHRRPHAATGLWSDNEAVAAATAIAGAPL